MPVGSFITQPSANGLYAAYRPVIIRVNASSANLDEAARPPVVYCDIYFNEVFYKTLAKTLYAAKGVSSSEWQFDIQDAAQEYLGKFLATYGVASVVEASTLVCKAQVKIRSSKTNEDGFVEPEGTAPVQGTAETDPVSGDGTASNVFYIVNATLQHEDIQDLAQHLGYFKNGEWSSDTLPLSHRPDGYKQGYSSHDTFPIIYRGSNDFKTLRLNYRYCGQSTFHQATANIAPAPECKAIISTLTVTHVGDDYGVSWTLISGSPAKYIVYTPEFDGGNPQETTDTSFSFGSALPVGLHQVTVRPVCLIEGEFYLGSAQTVVIKVNEAPVCVPVDFDEVELPDGEVGVPYLYLLPLTGTAPFSLSNIVKPTWMNISVVGSEVRFMGTPTAPGTELEVSFDISNCSGAGSESFTDTIDVEESESEFKIINDAPGWEIASVSPLFYTLLTGSLPVEQEQQATGVHTGTSEGIAVEITGIGFVSDLQLIVDGSPIQTLEVTISGTYVFDSFGIDPNSTVEIKLVTP